MSAISGYISTIQNAVYGEQVRTAIVNALLACYSDVENPDLQSAAFQTAIENAYEDGILDITTVTSFNSMTNQNIIYRYNGTAAGKQKGLYYYSALSSSWVLIGSEIQKVSLASQMTDVNDIYKYIGTESGMVQNSLYYHDGTEWAPIAPKPTSNLTSAGAGKPADAYAVGQALSQVVGITPSIKTALLNCFRHVAWVGTDGSSYIDALESAINGGGGGGDIPEGTVFEQGNIPAYEISGTPLANNRVTALLNDLTMDVSGYNGSITITTSSGYQAYLCFIQCGTVGTYQGQSFGFCANTSAYKIVNGTETAMAATDFTDGIKQDDSNSWGDSISIENNWSATKIKISRICLLIKKTSDEAITPLEAENAISVTVI